MKNRVLLITLAVLALGLFVPANIRAEDEPEAGVARISVINGDVSTQRGDSGEWVAATVNTPVVAGDKVATAEKSRTELQLDFANVLRLDQKTEAKIADLTPKKIQLQLSTGLVDLSVFKGAEADVEIDTPNMAVHPLGEGIYRIEVDSADQTQVTVRRGAAEVSTPQGSTKVEKDQTIYIHGTDNPEYRIDTAQARDDWDKWNNERDQQITQAQAWRHTDRYYTGSNDLDANGQWSYVPGYDWCWTPYVDAGWVPYSDGRWLWEPYWGWTWVSYEPWGWAPYHYGRWFFYGGGWRWWPGVGFSGPRPIWAPGYVSFFGFGGRNWGVGIGFGFGSIGWLPLGPRDPFNPWWGRGHGYSVTNITNITNINNQYGGRLPIHGGPGARPNFGSNLQNFMTDPHVRGALTTVSTQDFANGHIAHNGRPADENMLRQASVVRGTLPVVPTRASLQPSNKPVNRAGLPSSTAGHFFSRSPVTAARTPSFTSEASQIRQMAQRGPTANAGMGAQTRLNNLRTEGQMTSTTRPGGNPVSPAARSNPAGTERQTPNTGQTGAPGWQRFGSGSQIGRGPASVNTPGSKGAEGTTPAARTGQARQSTPAPQGNQGGGGRSGAQPAPGSGRTGTSSTTSRETPAPRYSESRPAGPQGGWQRFSSQSGPSRGGAGSTRPFESRSGGPSGWNAPAPRSGGANYGWSRPPLQLNRPIMRERSSGGGYYGGGGGRTYSAPSGGNHGSYSAPRGGGGGGGGHSSGSSGSHGGRR